MCAVVYPYLRGVGDEYGCRILAVGGIEDHVLLGFSTTISIAELVRALKGASSRRANEAFPGANFKWQGGYGVFPVAPAGLDPVKRYIHRQAEYHAQGTTVPHLETTGHADVNPGRPEPPRPTDGPRENRSGNG